jgi:hypothetical protein
VKTENLLQTLQAILEGYRRIHRETARLSADSQPEEFGLVVDQREDELAAITRYCRQLDSELPGWRTDGRSAPQLAEIYTVVKLIGAADTRVEGIMAVKMKEIGAELSRAHDHSRATRSYAGHSRL